MTYRKESKRRKVSKRRILVLCEGKTEKFYLEGFMRSLPKQLQRDVDLQIVRAKQSDPVATIKEIKNRLGQARTERQPYEECWLIFDDDNRDLEVVFYQLGQEDIHFVFNSISIEFWFLLHYQNTSRQFPNADSVIAELEKNFGKYSKTDYRFWDKLKDNYEKAKANAQQIRRQHDMDGIVIHLCKPYSNMDKLVDRIKSFI